MEKHREIIKGGEIRLEIRCFDNITKVKENVHVQMGGPNETETLLHFFREFKVSYANIPIPNTYEELQQQIARIVPTSCGIAAVERLDGTVATPPYGRGELIVFREITQSNGALDSYQSPQEHDWEQEVYKKFITKSTI